MGTLISAHSFDEIKQARMDTPDSSPHDFPDLVRIDADTHVTQLLSDETPEPALLQYWELPDLYPDKPSTSDYGFLKGQRRIRCSEKKLRRVCKNREVSAVWTPETPYLVPPIEVPALEPLVRNRLRGTLLLLATVFVLLGLFFFLGLFSVEYDARAREQFLEDAVPIMLILLTALVIGFVYTSWLHRRRRAEPVADAAKRTRYKYWVRTGANLATRSVVAGLTVIFILSLVNYPFSILDAGLVKSAVREGEIWRLLTGPMMHLNFFHLAVNGIVLGMIGQEVERVTSSSMFALVLLASLLGGSIASTLLLTQTSIGISGGVFGLIGFLTIFRWRARVVLPKGLFFNILVIVVLISADTLIDQLAGMKIIDFAGHFGGLLVGLVLGLLYVPRQIERVPALPRGRVARMGKSAWVILVLGMIMTGAILLMSILG